VRVTKRAPVAGGAHAGVGRIQGDDVRHDGLSGGINQLGGVLRVEESRNRSFGKREEAGARPRQPWQGDEVWHAGQG
jgi:hypothetical protein